MSGNTFGTLLCLTTFGESHGPAIGGVVDGLPSKIEIDTGYIQHELDRRKPGQSKLVSARSEADTLEILSGVFEGRSTGAPIAFMIRNLDPRSGDYEPMRDVLRPSHADFTYLKKYGIRDHRGGGRSSARETAARVVAGALARLFLKAQGISITAFTSGIGPVKLDSNFTDPDLSHIEEDPLRCPDREKRTEMIQLLEEVKDEGDSVGSTVSCIISGCPAGLGEPVFDKLEADLAKAMLSINGAMGFEFGSGFEAAVMKGSENNDPFISEGEIHTRTNHSGGIQGGISNGNPVYFRIAFKPIASIRQRQSTVDLGGQAVDLEVKGRHDLCIAPRAVPIVEAMAALVIADHLLRFNAYREK